MSLLMQAGATGVPVAAALAGGITSVRYRRSARQERRRALDTARDRDARVKELEAVGVALDRLSDEVVPAIVSHPPRSAPQVSDLVPPTLMGSALEGQLTRVARTVSVATDQAIGQVRQEATVRQAGVQQAAQDSTRAVVRAVASAMVVTASRLSRSVSTAVRQHDGDEAYASLMGIDRHAQQLLLAAQSYQVLSGGTLSRRWPDTPLTDVVRASLGYLEGFERVQHEAIDDVAVSATAVGPVIHAAAMLLDNALRYSPPKARVEVRLNRGYHGVTVTIDDAGICMNKELLREARQILSAGQQPTDLALEAQPRVGLRVVAALGARYGFQADVQAPNHFLGTRALLFLPKEILMAATTSSTPVAAPAAPERLATTENGLTVRRRRATSQPAPPDEAPARDSASRVGRASIAADWAHGIRQARRTDTGTGTGTGTGTDE